VSDPVALAKSARESLSKGLNALQSDPSVPPQMIELGAPIAQAMGALHQIEKNGGAQIAPFADNALNSMRSALGQMQTQPNPPAALVASMEAVAASLGLVHKLSQMTAKSGAPAMSSAPAKAQAQSKPASGPAPGQTAHFPQGSQKPPAAAKQATAPMGAAPMQSVPAVHIQSQAPVMQAPSQAPVMQAPVMQAPSQAPVIQAPVMQAPSQAPVIQAPVMQAPSQAPVIQAPSQAPVIQAPPQGPSQAPGMQPPQAPAAQFAPPVDPFAKPAGSPQAAPNAAPPRTGASIPSPPNAGGSVVDAALGAHSPTNFYKGLSGNDIIEHGGLFIATYMIPKIGAPVRLRIALPGGYEFEANAVVKWSRESGDPFGDSQPGFGAQFTAISPEARQLVYRYVRNREPLFHDDL
jgi:hypothetical protein